jgi:hypothetical protein
VTSAQEDRRRRETGIRIILYVVGGLLAAAAVLSLVLDRWDILVGVALGLVAVITADPFAWRNSQSDEPSKWPDLSKIDDTGRTTYYYDDDDTSPASGTADDQCLRPDRTENEGKSGPLT